MTITERLFYAIGSAISSLPLRAVFYVVAAGSAFLVVKFLMQRWFEHRRITKIGLKQGQIQREFLQSMRTIGVFAIVHAFLVFSVLSGWTRMYFQISEGGWLWFLISIGVMVIVHDTYFYWTHRLMHHPMLFQVMHRTHHQSICTTPWAAYSFSSWEALVQAGIAPLVAFTIPVHPVAFGLFMIWQMTFNVAGHCGYEIFPRRFIDSQLAKILNSVTHHGLHHEKVHANFGLYFNVWDRIMGTNHAHYETRFEQLTEPVSENDEKLLVPEPATSSV